MELITLRILHPPSGSAWFMRWLKQNKPNQTLIIGLTWVPYLKRKWDDGLKQWTFIEPSTIKPSLLFLGNLGSCWIQLREWSHSRIYTNTLCLSTLQNMEIFESIFSFFFFFFQKKNEVKDCIKKTGLQPKSKGAISSGTSSIHPSSQTTMSYRIAFPKHMTGSTNHPRLKLTQGREPWTAETKPSLGLEFPLSHWPNLPPTVSFNNAQILPARTQSASSQNWIASDIADTLSRDTPATMTAVVLRDSSIVDHLFVLIHILTRKYCNLHSFPVDLVKYCYMREWRKPPNYLHHHHSIPLISKPNPRLMVMGG